ncbi:dTDP-4-dehydrorhamnose 3,5-epimerase [Hymenobacter daecheongensis DSM 21074]|uniref:dTDP-4-dehydrorhamnose 3,5-epimerase n=1 Tax=Hymenobacter daecheongensis DSM 21074 TaxID=1121955 RepID=A0A1M6KLJ2_9BACT|nr:dTDP-4-dehydrorhamnose 3,5-epimerase [Hymenobacter daecheongensis]SHJ59750.1 dTDP-4-dehydrorhamnose 3,5-epimerase [Hymenobacter daecheongensis DSM 21074]
MIFTETELSGAFIIDVDRMADERGFFARSWCEDEFAAHGILMPPLQANVSSNPKRGTLRGMHYQLAPYEETKLIRCTHGAIYDVIVDLREESATYGQWLGVELTASSFRMLFVPARFAHGFLTLTDNTDVCYQVSAKYAPGSERGLRWNDPAIRIQWPFEPVLVSEKDRHHPDFRLMIPSAEAQLSE